MINHTVKLCLSASGLIALALFVITLHTGGRVAGLNFLELLAIACAVQVVGHLLMAYYYVSLTKAGLASPDYMDSKTFELVAVLIALIGVSACGGGGLLIFR